MPWSPPQIGHIRKTATRAATTAAAMTRNQAAGCNASQLQLNQTVAAATQQTRPTYAKNCSRISPMSEQWRQRNSLGDNPLLHAVSLLLSAAAFQSWLNAQASCPCLSNACKKPLNSLRSSEPSRSKSLETKSSNSSFGFGWPHPSWP